MDLSKLNEIAREGYVPTKRLVDLTKGQRYMITSLKTMTTKYGQTVLVELESEYDVFMTKRVSKIFSLTSRTPRTSMNYL